MRRLMSASASAENIRAGFAQQLDCHLGCAAELARQRPLRPLAGNENAAKDARAGRRPHQFVELVSAVEGEQAYPRTIGEGDILFLLDRVAEGQSRRRNPVAEAQFDFAAARHVEIGAFAFEQGDDFGGRIGLYSVVDAREWEMSTQRLIGFGDHVEIDDEARGLGGMFGKKTCNFLGHYLGQLSAQRLKATGIAGRSPEAAPPLLRRAASVRPMQTETTTGTTPRGRSGRLCD